MTTAPLSDLLQEALAALPESRPTSGLRDTVSTLRHLASVEFRAANADDRAALEALCRKASVAHRLWASYDMDWQRPVRRDPAPAAAWLALALILWRAAEVALTASEDLGEGLKLANGALAALDGAQSDSDGASAQRVAEAIDAGLRRVLEPA